MRKLLLASTAAAALTLGFAGTADAFTVTKVSDVPTAWTNAFAGTTNTLNTPGTFTVTPSTRAGNSSGIYRSPFDDSAGFTFTPPNPPYAAGTEWPAVQYYAVGPGNPNNPAIMTFTVDQTSLSLLWGSVDDYNKLEFFNNGSPVATVVNTDIVPAPALIALGASYVTISGLLFDEIRFSSSANAFEFSNLVTTPVPIPAALPLMLTALAGLGLVARRRSGDSA